MTFLRKLFGKDEPSQVPEPQGLRQPQTPKGSAQAPVEHTEPLRRAEFLEQSAEEIKQELKTLPVTDKESLVKHFKEVAGLWGVSVSSNVKEGSIEHICSVLVGCLEQDIRDSTKREPFLSIGPADAPVPTIRVQIKNAYHFVGRFGDDSYMTVLHRRF